MQYLFKNIGFEGLKLFNLKTKRKKIRSEKHVLEQELPALKLQVKTTLKTFIKTTTTKKTLKGLGSKPREKIHSQDKKLHFFLFGIILF